MSVVDAATVPPTIAASVASIASVASTTHPEDKPFDCRWFLLHCLKQANLVVVTASQGNTAATTITTTSPSLIDNDSDVSKVPVQHSVLLRLRRCVAAREVMYLD